jgi:glycerophosphoryl diester phosphodiesterase
VKLPLILGHRGARTLAPENSVPSFQKAIHCGADGIELDVHLTKDNKLVVMHDSTLKRVNGKSEIYLKDLTLKEVKQLDISHLIKEEKCTDFSWNIKIFNTNRKNTFVLTVLDRSTLKESSYNLTMGSEISIKHRGFSFIKKRDVFFEKEFTVHCGVEGEYFENVNIPELSEALAAASGHFVNIEIKRGEPFYPGIIDALMKETESFGYDKILFTSFNYETLLEMKRRYPFVKANRLYMILRNPVKAAEGVDGVNPLSVLIGKKGIMRVHRAGKTVFPWVVNKPESAVRFSIFGADGLITDRPCLLVKVRDLVREITDAIEKS